MMKQELESLIGYEIPYELYRKAEIVYTASSNITKTDIAEIYLTDHTMITERLFKDVVEFEKNSLEQQQKIDELETQLLQYQAYVSDLTVATQKNISKDFCPNIEPLIKQEGV